MRMDPIRLSMYPTFSTKPRFAIMTPARKEESNAVVFDAACLDPMPLIWEAVCRTPLFLHRLYFLFSCTWLSQIQY
jgi:hypothetical protein